MSTACSVGSCTRSRYCRGWCQMHYNRWRRTGDPLGRVVPTPMERFIQYCEVDRESGCWLWIGGLDTDGYGIFTIDGKGRGAHRWSYEHHIDPIPEGLVLDHLCRTRRCVNPAHLEPVTHKTNILRGEGRAAANALKTHCPQGHPYDETNTNLYEGRRYCRRCQAA